MVRPMPMTDNVANGCCIFVVGAIGGSVLYFVDGALRSSSKGCRLAGGVQGVIANGPRVRRWAAWSGVFNTVGQFVADRCNTHRLLDIMVAGGAANALFSMHRGPGAAVRSGRKGAACSGVAAITIYSIIGILESH